MTRLIGHLMAAIEMHSSQKLSLHPNAIQIKRHGEIRQTSKTYWRTKQSMLDRYTDREGAPLCEMINVTSDTLTANPAGLNITSQTHPDCVAT